MKKRLALLMATLALGTSLLTACGGPAIVDSVDETKTTLRIANYNGGVGEEWLDKLAARFEEAYKDEVFEIGKKGVDVRIDHQKNYSGSEITTSLRADTNNHIYFTQAVQYHLMANDGLFADITDLVTNTVGSDGKKIVDKLSEDQKSYLQNDNKYYAIPHYELYNGVQYDAGVFLKKRLFFSDAFNQDGTRKFITADTTKKSPGPDGKYNTYDDGLPSSYEEFYRVLDQMKANDVIPFVWTGKSPHYTNMLLISLFDNYIGKDGYDAMLNYEEATIEVVKSVSGGAVQTAMETLTKETAYKVKSSAAMYYALEFCQKVFAADSGNFPKDCVAAGFSHLDAQERLWNSGLGGDKYVAMLIDGNYSYNESEQDGIIDRLKEDYKLTYKNKDIRYMPLPHQYSGTVKEGEGSSPVLSDSYAAYTFINANTEGVALEVAKEFLSFAYTDAQLEQFTLETNGVLKGVSYDLTNVLANDSLCANGKNMIEIKQASVEGNSFIYPWANTKAFLNNAAEFNVTTGGAFWQGKTATIVFNAFNGGMTAAKYFEEVQWTAAKWADIIKD